MYDIIKQGTLNEMEPLLMLFIYTGAFPACQNMSKYLHWKKSVMIMNNFNHTYDALWLLLEDIMRFDDIHDDDWCTLSVHNGAL